MTNTTVHFSIHFLDVVLVLKDTVMAVGSLTLKARDAMLQRSSMLGMFLYRYPPVCSYQNI